MGSCGTVSEVTCLPGAKSAPPAGASGAPQRWADRVAALVGVGDFKRAIAAATGVDKSALAPERLAFFLVDVAQAQYGLAWYADALRTIGRAQAADPALVNHDITVRLMVHGIATQRAEPIDERLLNVVGRRFSTLAAASSGAHIRLGGVGGPPL